MYRMILMTVFFALSFPAQSQTFTIEEIHSIKTCQLDLEFAAQAMLKLLNKPGINNDQIIEKEKEIQKVRVNYVLSWSPAGYYETYNTELESIARSFYQQKLPKYQESIASNPINLIKNLESSSCREAENILAEKTIEYSKELKLHSEQTAPEQKGTNINDINTPVTISGPRSIDLNKLNTLDHSSNQIVR
jgi:hypothetical protein